MKEIYENVSKKQFQEFIDNYPRKLTVHTVNFCSPPLVTYIDFEIGEALDGIVAKEYLGTDEKDDLWYMPRNQRYCILKNYNEVFQNAKEFKPRKPDIFANAVLKDDKLIFWWTGGECTELYDFFKDFWHAGLNFAMEIETGRYELVKQKIEKMEDDKDFYRQYELYEPFKGQKPY